MCLITTEYELLQELQSLFQLFKEFTQLIRNGPFLSLVFESICQP